MSFPFLRAILLGSIFLYPCICKAISFELHEKMKPMNKSELHLHLGGAWPLGYLQSIASVKEFEELSSMLSLIQKEAVDYASIFHVFTLIGQIMNSEEKIEQGVIALCQDLAQDHVVYAEFRTGLKDLGNGLEGHLNAVLRGVEQGTKDSSLQVGVLLSLRRDTPAALAEKTLDLALKYQHQGIIGIDVSGNSIQGNGQTIFPTLIRAKKHYLPITLHLGESPEETPHQQMLELNTIQPERIGHGVHLCEEALTWIKEKKLLIELCLTSAVKAGMIQKPQQHPALPLLLQGYPIAICTDDPLVFNTTLSKEYAYIADVTGLTPEKVQELQKDLYRYSFLSTAK